MEDIYEENAKIFKALSDPNRLKVLKMLSTGEKCACVLLKNFEFSQPTLSHHMKILTESGLVSSSKKGTWNHYKININNANKLALFYMNIITNTQE